MSDIVALTIAAFLTAAISGTVGMGGGVTLLAAMTIFLPASAVVPLHGLIQLFSNGTRILAFLKHVKWAIALWFLPPCIVGVAAATMVWDGDKMHWFKPAIGLSIIAFLLYRHFKPTIRNLPMWSFGLLGAAAGLIGIFIGAIGPFIAPFFLRDDLEKEEIVGTKAACQAFLHVLKIPAFLTLGFAYEEHVALLIPCIIAVFAGTFFGKAVLAKLDNKVFVWIFQTVLILVAAHLIISSII